MFMLPGSIEESKVPAIKTQAMAFLKDANATVTSEFDMGRRRLAYPIKDQTHGYYHVLQFDIEATGIQSLDTKFRLDAEIKRHLITRSEPMTAKELEDMINDDKEEEKPAKETDDIAQALPVKEKTTAKPVAAPEPAKVEEAPAKAAPVAAEGKSEQLSIEDLDKQLDAILDDTDLESKL